MQTFALHCLTFPALCGEARFGRTSASLAAALGGISAASWLSATLLGIAREQAKGFDYADFMVAYAGIAAIALTVVRPRIVRKLAPGSRWFDARLHGRADLPRLL